MPELARVPQRRRWTVPLCGFTPTWRDNKAWKRPDEFEGSLLVKLIQVLGPGCAKCTKLKENVEAAVKESGVEAIVEKITDINVITGFGVMTTPAVVIDGEV
jgi:small redox-active disulfide protein 2